MDQYFFEMTALGWTYHSRPLSSNAGHPPSVDPWYGTAPYVDACYLGSFGGEDDIFRLRTVPSVKRFLAIYQKNVGYYDYEYPSNRLRNHVLAEMGFQASTYIRPTRRLEVPDYAAVEHVRPRFREITPSLIGRGLLRTSTMDYLNRYRFSDVGMARHPDMAPPEPNTPYSAHLRLQWARILSTRVVRAPLPHEANVAILNFNDAAVRGEGDPHFDPYEFFLTWDEGIPNF